MSSTRAMLLIFGSGGGVIASVIVIGAGWPPKKIPFLHLFHPKSRKVAEMGSVYQDHRAGYTTTHKTTQALLAWSGGAMGSRNMHVLVFRSRGSRDRRRVILQQELKFCLKAQQLRKRLNQR